MLIDDYYTNTNYSLTVKWLLE